MSSELKAGIVGVAGYTGAELVRLIHAHPKLSLCWVAGHSTAGQVLGDVLPSVRGLPALASLVVHAVDVEQPESLPELDVVFVALPHAASAKVGAAFFRKGVQVVDLSADFRFDDLSVYERWYGQHPEKDLAQHARYGLVEWHGGELKDAKLIAAPGCYVTAAVLALGPLLSAGLVDPTRIVIDAKSGVSGAGRKPNAATHLPEAAEGLRAYKVAGTHRHTPEIEQELSKIAGKPTRVVFTPHLVPMSRGILACAYATALPQVDAERCRAAARAHYGEGLVGVLDAGQLPDTLWVRGTARALVAYEMDPDTKMVIAFCALDNLSKGASSQAVQALNVARGWPESTGLPLVAQFP